MVKNLRICGSGIYTYDISECDVLHLTPIPKAYSELQYVNVYRPPSVLEENKDKFARVPIITGHHTLVTPGNAQSLMVGLIGDTVESEVGEDGELYLYATGTVVTEKGLETYEKYRQLSVGYDPICIWSEGEHNGVKYQAVLTGFNDVNHVLICQFARGGPQCTVMDSLDQFIVNYNSMEEKPMSFFNRTVNRKSSPELVPTLLRSIAFGADMKTQSEQIKAICGDSTFLKGLNELKDIPDNELLSATETLSMYYRKNVLGDEEKEEKKEEKEVKDEEPEEKKEKEVKDEEPEEKKEKEVKDEEPEEKKEKKEAKDGKGCLSGDEMNVIIDAVVEKVMSRLGSTPISKPAGDSQSISSTKFFNDIFGGK